MALAALGSPGRPVRAQVVIPPTVLTVVVATDVPPPTEVPPTAVPASATVAPPPADPGERREEVTAAPPLVPGVAVEGSPTSRATRTRRPTRTPRTTPTFTPTPMGVGALQVTLAADPGMPVPGEAVLLTVSLLPRGDAGLTDVTLQAVTPAELSVNRVDASLGETARSGRLVRWYVPALASGQTADLLIVGVLGRAPADGVQLCVTALSAGSPIEHCARFATTANTSRAAAAASDGALGDTEGDGAVEPVWRNPRTLGLAIFLTGLLAVGVLLGQRLRDRARDA